VSQILLADASISGRTTSGYLDPSRSESYNSEAEEGIGRKGCRKSSECLLLVQAIAWPALSSAGMEPGPMRRTTWPVYLWPGLPQILHQGGWAALAVAIGAALLLNTTLLATFVWTELVASDLRIIFWAVLTVVWSGSAGISAWWDHRQGSQPATDPNANPFSKALDDYLKGDWFEAERGLNGLLRRDRRDVEARLMLATLLRHTKRFDEATRQLNILVRLEGAQKWELEIRREGELITEARRRTITDANTAQANIGEH
jgi:hypothetical protein